MSNLIVSSSAPSSTCICVSPSVSCSVENTESIHSISPVVSFTDRTCPIAPELGVVLVSKIFFTYSSLKKFDTDPIADVIALVSMFPDTDTFVLSFSSAVDCVHVPVVASQNRVCGLLCLMLLPLL